MRPRAAFLSLVGAALIAAGAPSALASSPVPRGKLTQHEFTLINAAQMGLGMAFSHGSTKQAFAQAEDLCRGVTFGISTPLLKSERASCLGQLSLTIAITAYQKAHAGCIARGAQGTLRCEQPLFKKLAGAAQGAYAVDRTVVRASRRRGFRGRCFAALAFTPPQLGDQRKLARTAKRLTVLIPGALNRLRTDPAAAGAELSRVQRGTATVDALVSSVLAVRSPDVSTCPQQTV